MSNKLDQEPDPSQPIVYQIRIKGQAGMLFYTFSITSKDMERKYLSIRNGSVVGKVMPHLGFVHASVLE